MLNGCHLSRPAAGVPGCQNAAKCVYLNQLSRKTPNAETETAHRYRAAPVRHWPTRRNGRAYACASGGDRTARRGRESFQPASLHGGRATPPGTRYAAAIPRRLCALRRGDTAIPRQSSNPARGECEHAIIYTSIKVALWSGAAGAPHLTKAPDWSNTV